MGVRPLVLFTSPINLDFINQVGHPNSLENCPSYSVTFLQGAKVTLLSVRERVVYTFLP
jgi:hypothetical protein